MKEPAKKSTLGSVLANPATFLFCFLSELLFDIDSAFA